MPYTTASDFFYSTQLHSPPSSQSFSQERDEPSASVTPPPIPTSAPSTVIGSSRATKKPPARSRKVTSSISKSTNPKRIITGTGKTAEKHTFHGIDLSEVPFPLSWADVPGLGPVLPGPDPDFLSDQKYSQEASRQARVYDCILAAMMTRRCKNSVEVTVTIAEKQPWRILKTQSPGATASWNQRLLSTRNTVEHLISMAQLPKDRDGYYSITDPLNHELPQRKDKNRPKGKEAHSPKITSYQDSETEATPTPTPSPTSSLYPSMTGFSCSSGVMGRSTPVHASSAAFVADTVRVYYADGNEGIQDSPDRQDALRPAGISEQDELAYFLVLQNLTPTNAQPFETVANVEGYGYPQLSNTSGVFLNQGYPGGFIARPSIASITASSPSPNQPHPIDAVATAGIMVPPYHPSYSYSGGPSFNAPFIGPPLGYDASVGWSESIPVPLIWIACDPNGVSKVPREEPAHGSTCPFHLLTLTRLTLLLRLLSPSLAYIK
ncbi:hypothetical protein M407DRAFT_210835 [Tulasnella calospora MUT 4182]|uniref:Uncharacterized protein n=1 Tax=Tulasnella calospora MUT 4182 TaxID=1051891 RepID=A0A0C3LV70_9AGAM|nr:hypothetical protein M407DRAFT_210835 [Tulasnella calospora MUT 4182]